MIGRSQFKVWITFNHWLVCLSWPGFTTCTFTTDEPQIPSGHRRCRSASEKWWCLSRSCWRSQELPVTAPRKTYDARTPDTTKETHTMWRSAICWWVWCQILSMSHTWNQSNILKLSTEINYISISDIYTVYQWCFDIAILHMIIKDKVKVFYINSLFQYLVNSDCKWYTYHGCPHTIQKVYTYMYAETRRLYCV